MKLKRISYMIPAAAVAMLLSNTSIGASGNFHVSDKVGNNTENNNSFEETVSSNKQTMYALSDIQVLKDTSSVAAVVETVKAGSALNILSASGELCEVLTASGNTGYVSSNKLTSDTDYVFNTADITKYATDGTELKKFPKDTSETLITLSENDEVHIIGTNDQKYSKVEKDGSIYYVDMSSLMDEAYVAPAVVTTSYTSSADYTAGIWDGQSLTRSAGTIYGPSGKETYYNLNMSGVVSIMRSAGYTDEYWVRGDGVKMFGSYVMIAADQSIRPLGSLVSTSLGTGIVCDTGSFIYSDSTQIDIAVAW